jgi:hypothetical protein
MPQHNIRLLLGQSSFLHEWQFVVYCLRLEVKRFPILKLRHERLS